MIEVITLVDMYIRIDNVENYREEVERKLHSIHSDIEHIASLRVSSTFKDNNTNKSQVYALFKVKLLEREECKMLDDYVGSVFPLFHNWNVTPKRTEILKISKAENDFSMHHIRDYFDSL